MTCLTPLPSRHVDAEDGRGVAVAGAVLANATAALVTTVAAHTAAMLVA
ncbi:hypothetical protein [Jatrophihabitans sp.]